MTRRSTWCSAARATGADLRGWQVDRAAREVLLASGFGAHVLHRTGHSLGTEVHGNGVHMDDYETHDDRPAARRAPASRSSRASTSMHFGVRTEVNMYVGTARRG